MRVVIHAGMHKTGSSAIQDHFFTHAYDDLVWAPWTEANHCGLFILLFQNPHLLADYHGFKSRGPEFLRELPAQREIWMQALTRTLDASAGKTVVLSAEDISAGCFGDAVERMRRFFLQWTDRVELIGYVRSPRSFALSQFQQMVKGGVDRLDIETLWPYYQARFEPLEQIFGAENVTIRSYDRQRLVGADIVKDFAEYLGLAAAVHPSPAVNAALSAEATALLFAQRRLGAGFVTGFADAYSANNAFIDRLQAIGSAKLEFSDALWEPLAEANAPDLDWIERRLGCPMADSPSPDAIRIGSADDLLSLAQQSHPLVEKALGDDAPHLAQPSLQETVRAVDQLRKLSY